MRIFRTKQFKKLADSQQLTDKALTDAMIEVRRGLVDAALGGDLYKKRVAIGSKGKSGGVRTILAFKSASNGDMFCIYVFPKSARENITKDEKDQLKLYASVLLGMDEKRLAMAVESGELEEVLIPNENKTKEPS